MMKLPNSKKYYNISGIEAIETIEELNMNFNEGSAYKYLIRSNNILPKGNKPEDMKKVKYYLTRCVRRPRMCHSNVWRNKHINALNKDIFDTDIYEAMIQIIRAVSEPGYYETGMTLALENISNVIN